MGKGLRRRLRPRSPRAVPAEVAAKPLGCHRRPGVVAWDWAWCLGWGEGDAEGGAEPIDGAEQSPRGLWALGPTSWCPSSSYKHPCSPTCPAAPCLSLTVGLSLGCPFPGRDPRGGGVCTMQSVTPCPRGATQRGGTRSIGVPVSGGFQGHGSPADDRHFPTCASVSLRAAPGSAHPGAAKLQGSVPRPRGCTAPGHVHGTSGTCCPGRQEAAQGHPCPQTPSFPRQRCRRWQGGAEILLQGWEPEAGPKDEF